MEVTNIKVTSVNYKETIKSLKLLLNYVIININAILHCIINKRYFKIYFNLQKERGYSMSIRLDPEKEKLVLQNRNFVHHIVRQLGIPPSDYEDVVSIGTIGLIKAANTFDNSKNTKFLTYASRCIKNEIFMYFRNKKSNVVEVSLEGTILYDKDEGGPILANIVSNEEENLAEKIEKKLLVENLISIILNLLKSRKRILMLYKIAGMSQSDISEIFNVSQSCISKLTKRSIKQIKSYFFVKDQFKEVFSMSIVDDSYKITFSSQDVSNFNKIFSNTLTKLTSIKDIPNFKISCTKERIIIQLPADPESFIFIAKIVEQIDEFVLEFGEAKEIKADQINENLSKTGKNSKEKIKELRNYFLSIESFTVKELYKKFPKLSIQSIRNTLYSAKKKGLIKSVAKGKYIVNKD